MNQGVIPISRQFAVMPRGLLGYQTPVPTTYPLASSDGNITNGLVAWWKLDEASGGVAADSSGNGLNGTLVSGHRFQNTPGAVGNCLTGMTTLRPVTVANNALLNFTGDFTICYWALPSAIDAGGAGLTITKNTNNAIGQWNLSLRSTGYNGFYFRPGTGGSDAIPLRSQIALIHNGYWHHICATRVGAVIRLYLDGVRVPSSGGGYADFSGNTQTLRLVGTGAMDDARLYDRALSDTEVRALFEYRGTKYWEP
jgi:hypothetical protein